MIDPATYQRLLRDLADARRQIDELSESRAEWVYLFLVAAAIAVAGWSGLVGLILHE